MYADIVACNRSKKDFYDLCKDIASNDRRNSDFEAKRKECIYRLQELFECVMGPYTFHRSAVEESAIELCVARNSAPTPDEMHRVFNQAEAYLKWYELLSGKANTYGIKNLFRATCCLAENDYKAFIEWCDFTQIEILMDIASYFKEAMGIIDQPERVDEELREKSIEEKKDYLEKLIESLAKQWYGDADGDQPQG